MRRGLKPSCLNTERSPACCFKPIPDEEGTETKLERRFARLEQAIASNRSPMRRGLKLSKRAQSETTSSSFKPIPDEEGTETALRASWSR